MADSLGDFKRQIDAVTDRVKSLADTTKVPLFDLFNPAFMAAQTDFPDFHAMLAATGRDIKTDDDFSAIPDDVWEKLIATRTRFATWKEMQQAAGRAWAIKKLQG